VFDNIRRRLGLSRETPSASRLAVPLLVQGAYRLHREEDASRFTALAKDAFPEFASRIECFAADWLGNQFATDAGRVVGGQPLILLLEPATGQALEIPANFDEFHARELVEHADACVALKFYKGWIASGGAVPGYDQCIGYKRPLYLGGLDDLENLKISDFDVYWTISGQLLAKTRGLPPGTQIGRVSIGD